MTEKRHPGGDTADPLGLEALWRLVEPQAGAQPADPIIGMTFGGVEIVRMVAEGGMGRVYEGRQASPLRAVAVKVLRPGPPARAAIRRFLQEARILGQLRHPWICQVYTAGTFECAGTQLPYFVMEFIPDALPITEYVRRHALPQSERIDLFAAVCDAVGYAHVNGVIHRDLKPGNILVDRSGHPRVIDFGIARGEVAEGDLPSLAMTATGEVLGTIQYMSPEQVEGTVLIDARADVYALGVILHELVADRPPYDLRDVPLLDAVRVIRDSRPTMVGVRDAGMPGASLVIARCLDKDPRQRYSDARALAAALRHGSHSAGPSPADRLRLLPHGAFRSRVLAGAVAVLCGAVFVIGLVRWSGRPTLSGPLPAPRYQSAAAIPPAAATLPFQYAFTTVLDEHADRYLVNTSNMVKWNDPREELRVNYWGPATNDVEGTLVYCFRFPGRTTRISLTAEVSCWDFEKHHGGFGRGAAAVEASRDGTHWVSLQDDIRAGRWGVSGTIGGEIPPELLGTGELWLKVRLLTEQALPTAGYTVAQFSRAVPGANREVFRIEADCVPPVPAE